jgi:hypothetical protein
MKYLLSIVFFVFIQTTIIAQCSLCTKTASQLGEKPAKALNKGIVYLALAPLAIGGGIWFLYKKYNAGNE